MENRHDGAKTENGTKEKRSSYISVWIYFVWGSFLDVDWVILPWRVSVQSDVSLSGGSPSFLFFIHSFCYLPPSPVQGCVSVCVVDYLWKPDIQEVVSLTHIDNILTTDIFKEMMCWCVMFLFFWQVWFSWCHKKDTVFSVLYWFHFFKTGRSSPWLDAKSIM